MKNVVWVLAGLIALGGCGDDDGTDDALPLTDLGPGVDLGPAADLGGAVVDAFTPPSDLGPPALAAARNRALRTRR